jgi:hypothetical protein
MIQRRRQSIRNGPARVAAVGTALLAVACSSASPATVTGSGAGTGAGYPDAIVVLGHSGTTGADSDPAAPGTDARQNSWATGDNPEVNSIYSRLLARNPAIRGHNTNLGVDGSTLDELGPQVDHALALKPLPDLFMIQEVDNDMRCDGTDDVNYPLSARTLSEVLTRITSSAPTATVLLVSSPPGTVDNYGKVVADLPTAKATNTGTGPCDMFDPTGKAVPAHWAYQEKVILSYHHQLETTCAHFPTCQYDGGRLYRMPITAADLTEDGNHLTISGQRKQAELESKVLGLD